MPGYVKSKYSKEFSSELRVRALAVLVDSPRALTIDEICGSDMALSGVTTQKMARSLNELVEAGFVSKSQISGRMHYKAVGGGAYED